MPFLIGRQRQRGVDKRDDRLRKIWGAAIADPLRITAVDHEARRLESRHVAGHAGLAGAEFPHQLADAVLPPIPYHPEGLEPDRLCESGKNLYRIHMVTYMMRLCA